MEKVAAVFLLVFFVQQSSIKCVFVKLPPTNFDKKRESFCSHSSDRIVLLSYLLLEVLQRPPETVLKRYFWFPVQLLFG